MTADTIALTTTPPLPESLPAALTWHEALADGTQVTIRPIGPSDENEERRFIEALSPESRRFRFLGDVKTPSVALLKQFTAIDRLRDMAFVALVDAGGGSRQIGVSRYSTDVDGSTCECAVVVSDEWQNRGVATLLMRHLVEYAKSHGIKRMYSVDSSANEHMHELAVDFGFVRRPDPDDAAQVLHVLDLQSTAH